MDSMTDKYQGNNTEALLEQLRLLRITEDH